MKFNNKSPVLLDRHCNMIDTSLLSSSTGNESTLPWIIFAICLLLVLYMVILALNYRDIPIITEYRLLLRDEESGMERIEPVYTRPGEGIVPVSNSLLWPGESIERGEVNTSRLHDEPSNPLLPASSPPSYETIREKDESIAELIPSIDYFHNTSN